MKPVRNGLKNYTRKRGNSSKKYARLENEIYSRNIRVPSFLPDNMLSPISCCHFVNHVQQRGIHRRQYGRVLGNVKQPHEVRHRQRLV